ncbi:hypothetical protein WMY93_022201 [Mugilogobius chulae]|uniref:Integrase core domain-containing protein n=1 Tax=Mugilogobius chulae TaxID=88201 RepID=A0AAW0NC20_9GOBI
MGETHLAPKTVFLPILPLQSPSVLPFQPSSYELSVTMASTLTPSACSEPSSSSAPPPPQFLLSPLCPTPSPARLLRGCLCYTPPLCLCHPVLHNLRPRSPFLSPLGPTPSHAAGPLPPPGLTRPTQNQTDLEELVSFVEEVLSGSGRLHGYRWLHHRAIQRGYVVSQETVRILLGLLDPNGVEMRRRRRLRRRQYTVRGPNALWHLDSYDKLKPYGIAINGCIDGFSRHIMWMEAYVTNSDPKVIADYYINTVTRVGGCPQRLRADPGTENAHVRDMQRFLRRNHTDLYAGDQSFIHGCSTANQRIESWWGILRRQCLQHWMDIFHTLKENGDFTGDFVDKNLAQFCFLNIIQVG